MVIKNRTFKRALALALAAVIGTFSLTSCKKDDDDNDKKSSTAEISSIAQDGGGLVLSIGDKSESSSIDLSITKVYTSEAFTVDKKELKPEKHKIFVVAEVDVYNKTSNIIEFDCTQSITPSIDNKVIDLKEWISFFPNTLDGMDNMLNRLYTKVLPENTSSGFIAFEAPEDFKYCEFSFCSSNKLNNVFRFINPKQADSPDKELNAIASADTNEMSLIALKAVHLIEYEDLPQIEYNQRYVRVTAAVKNNTDKLRDSYIYGFKAVCGGKVIKPLEVNEEKTFRLPPKNYSVYTLTFLLPTSEYTFDLVYTDLINDSSASVELETWKTE